ncbi:MAG TPA: helical backbone metal receptor [Steroidobacteraceae bacterium]|nr:helical backbone metal receptor [Steroidobacteraceae bacterium]
MTSIARFFNLGGSLQAGLALLCSCALLGALVPVADAATVTDDTGRQVAVPAPPLRIASLAPSTTAMLFAAGAGAEVIATTAYSVEPPAARRITRIGDAHALDLERLVGLHPDVVVAWPDGENPAETARIARLGIPIYREQVRRLADLSASIRRLGELAGTREAAARAARAVDARLGALEDRYARARPLSVLLQIWGRPLYTIGSTQPMSDALRICGARNVFGDLSDPAPAIATEAVIARNPDLIIAVGARREVDAWLEAWKRFPELRAVRAGHLIAFDDQRLTRLGPGMLDATEALCARIAQARRGQSLKFSN